MSTIKKIPNLSEGFSDETPFDALDYYNNELGMDIENISEKSGIDFNNWIEYEILLAESLSFEEYCFIKNKFSDFDLNSKSIDISTLHKCLFHFRLLNDE